MYNTFLHTLVFAVKLKKTLHRLLDSLVVECWLRVREVPGSIPSPGPRHTKDVIKMVPLVPLFGTQHKKGKYWLFLKNKDRTKNVMHNIWDRNPSKSKVIGRCGWDGKNEWQSRTLKEKQTKTLQYMNIKLAFLFTLKQLLIQLSHLIHSNQ